jgi:hypothetical protein
MNRSATVLPLQIAFCEAHLAHHTESDDPKNTPEIHAYIVAQLALAKSLLTVEGQVVEAERTRTALSFLPVRPIVVNRVAA